MKRIFAIVALLAAFATQAQTTAYTLADVSTHATASDCWMILNSNKVYNFTNYIAAHPGGSAMVPYCGRDGSQAFSGLPHSSRAISLQATYLIGALTTVAQPISVRLAPTNGLTTVGQTLQFTATVSSSSQGVAYTLAPPTLGTISASGLFTATTVGGGTITATSLEDATKSASALITVNAATPPTSVDVSISPAAVTLRQASRVRFRATLNHSISGVTWTTTGDIGTIDSSGVFTAGNVNGTGTVVATSVDDPTVTATAQVTVTSTTGNVCSPETNPRGGSDSHGNPRRKSDD
jgi:cytochrome b involved in lipid metabolism